MAMRLPTLIALVCLAATAAAQPSEAPNFDSLLKDLMAPPESQRPRVRPFHYEVNLPAHGVGSFIGTDALETHEPVAEYSLVNLPAETVDPMITASEQAALAQTWEININTAPVVLMARLPGLDFRLAQAVANHRAANGPFERPQDIVEVFGVTEFTYTQLQSHLVCVGDSTFDGIQASAALGQAVGQSPSNDRLGQQGIFLLLRLRQ